MLDRENLYNDPYDECGSFRLDRKDSGNPASAWYLDRFEESLESCTALLLERIGNEHIRAIILGGSFALGEGSIFIRNGSPVFLSDIDLLVVMESVPELLRVLAIRESLGRECEQRIPEASFIGRIDVGAVHLDELQSFPHSPGVFVIREHGRVLYGDGSVLGRLPSFSADRIAKEESLTLLENRMASLLGHHGTSEPGTGDGLYRFLYEICRTYTDLLTALTVVTSSFAAGYHERCRIVDENNKEAFGPSMDEPLVRKTRRWSEFKICPSLDIVGAKGRSLEAIWSEAATDLLGVWEKCVRAVYKRDLPAGDIRRLASARTGSGSVLTRIRSWRHLLKGMRRAEGLRTVLFAGRAIFSTTPEGFLRAASVFLVREASGLTRQNAVGTDPGGFPFDGTSIENAAESCNRWWTRIIFGRDRS